MPQGASCWIRFFDKKNIRYPSSARHASLSNSLSPVYRTRCVRGLQSPQRRSFSNPGCRQHNGVDGFKQKQEGCATSEWLRYGTADNHGEWGSRRRTSTPQETLNPHILGDLARGRDNIARTSRDQDPRERCDYREEFAMALRRQEVDVALGCLAAGAYDGEFIRSIPTTSFNELIALLDAQKTITQDADALAHFPRQRRKYMGIRPIASTVDRFLSLIEVIVGIRRNARKKLGVVEYRHLLRCAAKSGNMAAVEDLWHNMSIDDVEPDTQCFNAWMEARVWNGIYSPGAAAALRVTGWHMRQRELQGGIEFQNYRTGVDGIETQVKAIFNSMLDKGRLGDEETFCQMIVASAREGHISSVKAVLLRIWGIEVDAILSGISAGHPRKKISRDSPLYPTERLMFAVVHAFCSNNNVLGAFRILDYMHRVYDIHISSRIWQELFIWASVLARRRSGERAAELKEGQLPMSVPEALWHSIQAPPYNVAPTFIMHHFAIKALLFVQRMHAAKAVIISASNLYLESVKQAKLATLRLSSAEAQASLGTLPRTTISALKTEIKTLNLAKQRNHMLLRRWCRWWLWKGSTKRASAWNADWAEIQIPLFIEQLGRFCDNRVRYKTENGSVVEINQRTGVEGKVARLRREAIAEGIVFGNRKVTLSILEGQRLKIRSPDVLRWFPRGPQWSAKRMFEMLKRRGVRRVRVGAKRRRTRAQVATTGKAEG